MKPAYDQGGITLYQGNCLDVLPTLPDNSIDSIVTDPPYGLSFMGKDWDHGCPGIPFWAESLRVAKPGAYLLAFGGTRTFHRLACAIEDAGWEIRDCIMWVYGSGFPKSANVSKMLDKMAGVERPDAIRGGHIGISIHGGDADNGNELGNTVYHGVNKGAASCGTPVSPAAVQWQGWGTALKPAWEPIIVARKPLQGTVAANVLEWGTGGINVDGCRIGTDEYLGRPKGQEINAYNRSNYTEPMLGQVTSEPSGRWPANLVHDGSEEVLTRFPMTNNGGQNGTSLKGRGMFMDGSLNSGASSYPGDSGSAARFFYQAKASNADRDCGLEGDKNRHPTVKPTPLMRWLCRLVSPPGGTILDPFMGSGSTGKAAVLEGFNFIGIELDADYFEIAKRRIEQTQPMLEGLFA